MGKRTFQTRMCITCAKPYMPTGPKNRWCSLRCRLINQIDASGGIDACWPWTASFDKKGYGEIRLHQNAYTGEVGVYEDGTYFAHRIALAVLGNVDLTESDVVRHSCDNPACCNWHRHLIIGTQGDNVRDMIARGRQQDYSNIAKGENHGGAKISAAQAIDIFNAQYASYGDIAKRFGVSLGTVARIKLGQGWSKTTGAETIRPGHASGERHHAAKLTEEDVRMIRAFSGPARILAAQFGVSEVLIGKIRKHQLWSNVE